jgi:hypothetical protein
VAGQLPDLFGVEGSGGNFFERLWGLLGDLGQTSATTLGVGLASLALVLGLRRFAPRVPGSLVAVLAGIALVALGDLADHGVEVIGAVDGGFPVPALPSAGWDELLGLLPGAAAVAYIGYAESATVAESMANEHGYVVEPDRELRAVGVANVLSGLFQGFITGGGASQSAANDRAGAQTQLVSLLVSGLIVVTAVALLPLFRDLPQATLGAVVISAVIGFLNLAALERVRRLRRDSFAIALVAMVAVLTLGVLQGADPWRCRLRRCSSTPSASATASGPRCGAPTPRSGWSCSTCRSPPSSTSRASTCSPRSGPTCTGTSRTRSPTPQPEEPEHGHGGVASGSPGGSGSRRTSTSSSPRSWMRSSSPYSAAWSWTGP